MVPYHSDERNKPCDDCERVESFRFSQHDSKMTCFVMLIPFEYCSSHLDGGWSHLIRLGDAANTIWVN